MNHINSREPIIVIGPSIAYVPLTRNLYSLIDSDDAPRCTGRKWCAVWCPHRNDFIAFTNRRRSEAGKRGLYLSVHLMGEVLGMQVDHINHRTLDNRRSANLRHTTPSENSFNRRVRKTSKTGVSGVVLDPRDGRYYVTITIDKKRKGLGGYSSFEEASEARLSAELTAIT